MREHRGNGARKRASRRARAIRQTLAGLAARAFPLFERLSDAAPPAAASADRIIAAERMRAWCRSAAGGDEALFERRLAWDNLTKESVRPHLMEVACAPDTRLPAWVETLTRAILFSEDCRASSRRDQAARAASGLEEEDDPLAFGDVLEPFVRWARAEVDSRRGRLRTNSHGSLLLSDRAWRALERSLLTQLSELLSPSLYAEFERRRPAGRSLLGFFIAGELPEGERPRDYYRSFAAELCGAGILTFLENYPVLARLLAQSLEAWCDSTAELIERLHADLPLIRTHFRLRRPPTSVEEIEAGLSDPHHGGRFVSALTFDTGAKLVYKPRGLQLDAAFGAFLGWCNEEGRAALRPGGHDKPVTFHVVRLLDCGTHGWAEFVEHAPCPDSKAVERFYFGAGMLLCVLHLLGATDCHYENVVAHGERPVLIDAETILQPRLRDPAAEALSGRDGARSWDTVVRTGLLPQWDFSADGRLAVDSSGLGSFGWLQGQEQQQVWHHANTDDMRRGSKGLTPPARRNLPTLGGETALPSDYVERLVEGFESAYRFFESRCKSLLAAATAAAANETGPRESTRRKGSYARPPLAAFAVAKARYVARATQHYFALIRASRQPEHLRSGADRAILFDSLSRPFLTTREPPDLWHIRRSEWRALERLDVPYFLAPTTGASLHTGDGPPIPVPQLAPAFTDLCERLEHWDETRLRQQTAIIRGVFLARMAGGTSSAEEARPLPRAAAAAEVDAHRERLLRAARRIARELEAAALPSRDGSVYWLTLLYQSEAERYRLEPAGYELYEGSTGIALFLATLDAVTGGRRYRELILSALSPLGRVLRTPEAAGRFADAVGIGGASGLGSVVYALTRLAGLLDSEELLKDARRAATLIDDERIVRDERLDVIAGSAGAVLGLLALGRRTGDETLLRRAAACGEHLLRKRTGRRGRRVWKTFADRPLTGLAHGAAGFALALLRLYETTGDARFRDAAREAVRYERGVFNEQARNWPDYRGEGRGCSTMWCHGAPGIGLARLAGISLDEDPESLAEVEAALKATERFGLCGPDYLCCGTLGRIELLLEAGVRLNRATLVRRALATAAALVERARREGGFRLVEGQHAAARFKPGLFRGAAGVGYGLLRVAYPQRVPSVLTWE